jgi:hypothetical protein
MGEGEKEKKVVLVLPERAASSEYYDIPSV